MQSEQSDESGWEYNSQHHNDQKMGHSSPQYSAEFQNAPSVAPDVAEVNWSASEFVAYHKPAGWYGMVVAATLAFAGVIFLLTKDFFAVATIMVMAGLFLLYANRKPRVLNYSLGKRGVHIGPHVYPYGLFRSFSVTGHNNLNSITLIPLQRLKPPIDMYFDPEDGDQILEVLSQYLPHEQREMDAVDRFLHRIKF